MNISRFSDEKTARTINLCAQQRAINLATFDVKKVIELCVGPSLRTLAEAYRGVGIEC